MPSKNLGTLNNGWHLSGAPMGKKFRVESRRKTIDGVRKNRLVMLCAEPGPGGDTCGWGIFILNDNDPAALAGYTVDLDFLKARITDHWLRMHAAQIAAETWC